MAKDQSKTADKPAQGLKGYRVDLTDVTAPTWGLKRDGTDFEVKMMTYPVRTVLSGWLFQFSGGLTWANGLHKNLDLMRRIAEEKKDDNLILLSDAEYTILKGVAERAPAPNPAEALIVEKIMAAEQVALAPAS